MDGMAGLNVNSSLTSGNLSFTVNNSKLYATWTEFGGVQYPIWVKAYNGNDASPSWSFLDSSQAPINCSNYLGGSGAQLLSFENGLYAISSQQCGGNEQIRFEGYK